jgi:hypothetical protein
VRQWQHFTINGMASIFTISKKFIFFIISWADRRKKLTISWDNSILSSYCALKANKYISVCWPRQHFLWAPADTFFFEFCIKLLQLKNVKI